MNNLDREFFDKFNEIEKEYDELSELLQSVEIISDNKLFNFYKKRHDKIYKISNLYKNYKKIHQQNEDVKRLLKEESDIEFLNELKIEQKTLQNNMEEIFENLKKCLKELEIAEDQKAKIEITYKSGQSEFLAKYMDIVKGYSEIYNTSFSVEKQTETNLTILIEGEDVFDDWSIFIGNSKLFMFEKESVFGISVIKNNAFSFEISEDDIVVETLKSGGAGGQHINKTESAIRLIHKPTGISVLCQDERSQLMNKTRAFENLKNKIKEYYSKKEQKLIEIQRRNNKNALFSNTPTTIFDFDKNIFYCYKTKQSYKIKEILCGKIKLVTRDIL